MVDFYRFAVYLGFAGLACMALLGVANGGGGHAHGHAGHGHGGHAHGDIGGHASQGHAAHHGSDPGTSFGVRAPRAIKGIKGSKGSRSSFFLSLLSPQTFFSLMLGFGATGVLTKHYLPTEPFRACLAIVGGLLFEKCLITPVWNGWMRFASTPARTLESAVCEEATAITAFDATGCGLISIDLDGHEIRILARLAPVELQNPQRVRAGDRLFVESVDTARNSCVVSRFEHL